MHVFVVIFCWVVSLSPSYPRTPSASSLISPSTRGQINSTFFTEPLFGVVRTRKIKRSFFVKQKIHIRTIPGLESGSKYSMVGPRHSTPPQISLILRNRLVSDIIRNTDLGAVVSTNWLEARQCILAVFHQDDTLCEQTFNKTEETDSSVRDPCARYFCREVRTTLCDPHDISK